MMMQPDYYGSGIGIGIGGNGGYQYMSPAIF
jgi:hypothetical protein